MRNTSQACVGPDSCQTRPEAAPRIQGACESLICVVAVQDLEPGRENQRCAAESAGAGVQVATVAGSSGLRGGFFSPLPQQHAHPDEASQHQLQRTRLGHRYNGARSSQVVRELIPGCAEGSTFVRDDRQQG